MHLPTRQRPTTLPVSISPHAHLTYLLSTLLIYFFHRFCGVYYNFAGITVAVVVNEYVGHITKRDRHDFSSSCFLTNPRNLCSARPFISADGSARNPPPRPPPPQVSSQQQAGSAPPQQPPQSSAPYP